MATTKKKTTRRKAAPRREPGEPVLLFIGPGRFAGIPARDLTESDLARIAYRRALAETAADGKRPDPRNPDPAALAAITAELTSSGLFMED